MGRWREMGSNGKRLKGVWRRRWRGSDGEAEGVKEEGLRRGWRGRRSVTLTPVIDTGGKFATGVVDNGGAP